MAAPVLSVLLITMNEREHAAVDHLFEGLDWTQSPVTVEVGGERTIRISRHHQQAQGNLEAAATVMQSLVTSKFDHVVGFGCCGAFDADHVGRAFLVADATYNEIGKVGRDEAGVATVGLKTDTDGVFSLQADTEILDYFTSACDQAGLDPPLLASVFGVEKVIATVPSPVDTEELITQLRNSKGEFEDLDTYVGRAKKFGETNEDSRSAIVDMESFGFIRGAEAAPQQLSILRIATDALANKNEPEEGADTDDIQHALLLQGTEYLLCLLGAIAKGGAESEL